MSMSLALDLDLLDLDLERINFTANCITIDHFSAFELGLVAPFLYAA